MAITYKLLSRVAPANGLRANPSTATQALSGLIPLAAAGGRRRAKPARGLFLLSLRRRWHGMLDLRKERSTGWALSRAGSHGVGWRGPAAHGVEGNQAIWTGMRAADAC